MPNRHTLSIEMECLRHTLLWFALRAETERLRRIEFVALAAHAGRPAGRLDTSTVLDTSTAVRETWHGSCMGLRPKPCDH